MRIVSFAAALAAAAVLTGCSDVPRGRIHGTVKYQGQPIPDGTVIFIAKDNLTHLADLNRDGSYEVSGVALGPVKVSVQQAPPRVASKGDPTRPGYKEYVHDEKAGREQPLPVKHTGPRLPADYANAEKSGLKFDLTSADQEWSIDLK
jgi:hypothetical protein